MSEQREKMPEISAWYAQYLRLTAFPVDPDSIDENDEKQWWEQLTGSEPESETKKKLERQYSGPYENAGLQLTVNPIFVQWVRYPQVDPKNLSDDFPNLGTFPDLSGFFASKMERWLEVAPPLKRLAFGTVLLQPVESRDVGYKRLNDYLPFVKLDPDASDTSDFSFKINRSRPSYSDIPGLKINRLMTWSFMQWEFDIHVSQGGNTPRQLPPASGFACRVELDINSAPDFEGKIPRDRLIPMWKELVQLAHEIADKGDCI